MSNSILLANGCSMCYGSGLYEDADTRLCNDNQRRMKDSWPGVLGKMLGFNEIINLGYPGGSNDRILRTTITWIIENWLTNRTENDLLFVCIGWSGAMRREFFINDEWRQLIPYHDYKDAPASMLNRVYREVAWSEYEAAIRFATQIISLQSFLKLNNIPYVFFDAITSFNRVNQDANGAINSYINQINEKNYFNLHDIEGCMSIKLETEAIANGHRHPNIDEHFLWAQNLNNFIETNNLLKNTNKKNISPVFSGTHSVEILDKKIGLATKPNAAENFNFLRLKGLAENPKSEKNKNFLTRIFHARKRDPFIYE